MKLGRTFCFLVVFASWAIAAHGQTAIDAGSIDGDAKIILNDPSCAEIYCVELEATTSLSSPPSVLSFGVPTAGPIPPGGVTCASNVFAGCMPLEVGGDFYGLSFFDGSVTDGEILYLSSNEPIKLTLPTGFSCEPPSSCPGGEISLSPELGSGILFMSGLVFLVFGRFARRLLQA